MIWFIGSWNPTK